MKFIEEQNKPITKEEEHKPAPQPTTTPLLDAIRKEYEAKKNKKNRRKRNKASKANNNNNNQQQQQQQQPKEKKKVVWKPKS